MPVNETDARPDDVESPSTSTMETDVDETAEPNPQGASEPEAPA